MSEIATTKKVIKSPNTMYYWLALFAFCFIAYQLVQDTIRPNYTGGNLTLIYLLGIAPNFFPSIGIPALFVIIFPQLNQTSKWLNQKKHITANLVSVTGLVSWEFLQTTTKRGKFDWNDVLWTLIGAIVFQIIWTMTPEKYKENYEEKY
jgi:glycopeptide antibiotics resistance protein